MIVVNNIDKIVYSTNSIKDIVTNTENTWQKDRSFNEKESDSSIGKLAEDIIENYIKENRPDIIYFSYDKFRANNFKKHAPFDGLLFSKEIDKEIVNRFIKKINTNLKR